MGSIFFIFGLLAIVLEIYCIGKMISMPLKSDEPFKCKVLYCFLGIVSCILISANTIKVVSLMV